MDSKKIIAAVVAALFCVTAYAYVDVGDSADAASSTYEIYVEIIDADGHLDDAAYVYFESDKDNAKFADAATKAFADAGLSKIKVTYDAEKASVSINYDGGSNTATYYSDGKEWVAVAKTTEDYIGHTKIAAAVGTGYISEEVYEDLTPLEQAFWKETGWGEGTAWAYMKVPAVAGTFDKIVDYKVNLTMIDDDLIKTSSEVFKFTCENEGDAWCYAFNQAVEGNSIFSKTVANYALGAITITFGDSFSNATYVKNDGKWVYVEDTVKSYTSGNDLDFELNHGYISKTAFEKLSSSEQKNWKESGMTYEGYEYMRVPSASSSSGDFPIIYVVVAIVAILLIACAAYYLMKNKKTA